MAPYAVQRVVAAGCTEALVAFQVPLPAPGGWELIGMQKTVLVDQADVTLGSALLRGRLRACYTVASAPAPLAGSPPSTVWHGPLTAVWAEAEVHAAIPIPEALPDLALEVTAAHVTGHMVTPLSDGQGLIQALHDQSLVHLAVRLTRTVDLHTGPVFVPEAPRGIAPPKQSSVLARFDSRSPVNRQGK